jgi:hypothetical protein
MFGCCCRFHFGYILFGALHEGEGVGPTAYFSGRSFIVGLVLVQHPSESDVKVELEGIPFAIKRVLRE